MKRQLFFVCPFSCLFSGFSVYFCRVFYAGNAAMAYTLLYYGSIKGYISCHGSPHRYGVGCYFRFVKDSSFVWHSTVRDILSPLSLCLYRNNSVCSEKTLVQERQARNAHGVARNNRRFCIFPFREHSSPIHFGGQRVSFGFLHSFAHCFALHMDGTRRETHPPPRTRFHSCLCGRGSCGHKRLDTRATEICRRHSRSSCCSHVGFLPTSHKACLCSLFGNIHNAKSICLRTAFYNYILPLLPSHNFFGSFLPPHSHCKPCLSRNNCFVRMLPCMEPGYRQHRIRCVVKLSLSATSHSGFGVSSGAWRTCYMGHDYRHGAYNCRRVLVGKAIKPRSFS